LLEEIMGTTNRAERWRAWLAAAGAVVAWAASSPSVSEAGPAAAAPRVRGGSAEAAQLLADARLRSSVVANLVERLEGSDLVVLVFTERLLASGTGDLTYMTSAGGSRFVRLRVSIVQPAADEVIAWLAHELQHAVELAAAPGVRDEAALCRLYREIGEEWSRGRFETQAARDVQAKVRSELRAALH
jgi:hypothetical protein